jgi:hypothetical protein
VFLIKNKRKDMADNQQIVDLDEIPFYMRESVQKIIDKRVQDRVAEEMNTFKETVRNELAEMKAQNQVQIGNHTRMPKANPYYGKDGRLGHPGYGHPGHPGYGGYGYPGHHGGYGYPGHHGHFGQHGSPYHHPGYGYGGQYHQGYMGGAHPHQFRGELVDPYYHNHPYRHVSPVRHIQ